jgi:hypothetical protein
LAAGCRCWLPPLLSLSESPSPSPPSPRFRSTVSISPRPRSPAALCPAAPVFRSFRRSSPNPKPGSPQGLPRANRNSSRTAGQAKTPTTNRPTAAAPGDKNPRAPPSCAAPNVPSKAHPPLAREGLPPGFWAHLHLVAPSYQRSLVARSPPAARWPQLRPRPPSRVFASAAGWRCCCSVVGCPPPFSIPSPPQKAKHGRMQAAVCRPGPYAAPHCTRCPHWSPSSPAFRLFSQTTTSTSTTTTTATTHNHNHNHNLLPFSTFQSSTR